MGLDEYMDMSTDNDSSSSKETESKVKEKFSDSASKLLKYESYYETDEGKIKKKGPFGYESMDEYEESIDGEFENDDSLIKYHLPFVPLIEVENKFTVGKRYRNSFTSTTHACITHDERSLGKVNRELVMLACGSSEKEECIEYLEEKHGQEFGPDTTIHLYIMVNTRVITSFSIADEMTSEWHTGSMEEIAEAAFFPDRLMNYREKDGGEHDLKHINHMDTW